MKEILSILAVPVSGLITYILGHTVGRTKTKAEVEKIQLENLQEIVSFYKKTFDDLKSELEALTEKCQKLSKEIDDLRLENKKLKQNIHALNQQLVKRQQEQQQQNPQK